MASKDINEFTVEAVFPLSATETTVTGHVAKGSMRTGEAISFVSAAGIPLLGAIVRIGTAETPINIAREGQKTSLVLDVEPQHLAPGARITSMGEDESYAATIVVTSESDVDAAATPDLDPALAEAERLVLTRKYADAVPKLEAYLQSNSGNSIAHCLLARTYLFSGEGVRDEKKALDHIKKAYEAGGADNEQVLETLAQALGANGETDHGLRFLERLHSKSVDAEARTQYAEIITNYRRRYKVADHWDFVDGFGDVIFSSNKISEIVKAIENESIPVDAQCRKNKTGALRDMAESIAVESPEVAAALGGGHGKGAAGGGGLNVADLAIGAGIGVAGGAGIGIVTGLNPVIGIVGGLAVGVVGGLVAGKMRSS